MTRRSILLLCAVLSAIGCGAGSAQAGFLDSLFGFVQAAPPVLQVQPLRPAERLLGYRPEKIGQARKLPAALRATTAADKQLVVERVAEFVELLRTRGAFAAFLLDPTLRQGDALVTESGIRIFMGPQRKTHLASELRPVARTHIANRSGLLELERVSHLGDFQVVASATSSAPPLTIVAQPAGAATGIVVVKPPRMLVTR